MNGELILKVAVSSRAVNEDIIHDYNMKHVKSKEQRNTTMGIGAKAGAVAGVARGLWRGGGLGTIAASGIKGAGAGLLAGYGIHKGVGAIWEAGGKDYLGKVPDKTLARTAKLMKKNDREGLNKQVLETVE